MMSIKVTCGECSRLYKFKDELRGRKSRCKDCNAVLVIDDVEDLDDLLEEDEESGFEPPVRKVGKRRRKRQQGSDFRGFLEGIADPQKLLGMLYAMVSTTLGQIITGVVVGYVLMALAAIGVFGRAGWFAHVAVLFAGVILIGICFMGAIIDGCKEDATNVLILPILNPVSVFVYIILSPNGAGTRRLMLVGICWTVCMGLASASLEPKTGFLRYRQDAIDWWNGRPAPAPN